jgi:quinolinate synthase
MEATREAFSTGGEADPEKIRAEVVQLKRRWQERLLVLTHHYQRPDIVRLGDVRGDSFELAREAARRENVEHIVFCGVRFMAEAAAVVARPGQKVHHPHAGAGCPLADFADAVQVERALSSIEDVKGTGAVMPVTYMNSDVEVKAVVGRHGGAVCTSSNARTMFEWALDRRPCVLFIPDEHLGCNTADALHIPDAEVVTWDPHRDPATMDRGALERARVVLWRGHCHVHTWFRPDHVKGVRDRDPEARIYVHPECRREVVRLADGAGSTRYLVEAAEAAPAGSRVYIGTEVNLVTRLAMENPDKTILPLARSLCPNMYRISMRRLRDTLAALPDAEPVHVPDAVRGPARTALERMLSITSRSS